jgi:hypothetical protein
MLKLFSHRLVVDGLGASAAFGIDKYVEILIRDVKGKPQNSHARLWLSGIEVPDEPIAVSDELTFRRPKPEDLLSGSTMTLFITHMRFSLKFRSPASQNYRAQCPILANYNATQSESFRHSGCLGLDRCGGRE